MPDDYRALAAAMRRPMRRWWLRVGSWWIVALALVLGWRCYTTWLWSQAIAQLVPVPHVRDLTLVTQVLALVLDPGAALLWTLAALHANRLLTELLHSAALADSARFLPVRFQLALRQGLVPATASLAGNLLVGAASTYWWAVSVSDRPNPWYTGYFAISEVLRLVATMLWFTAFIALMHTRPKLVWGWFAAAKVLSWLLFIATSVLIVLGQPNTVQSGGNLAGAWTWVIGLPVLVVMLAAFRARKMVAAYVGYGFVVLCAVVNSAYIGMQSLQVSAQWLPLAVQHTVAALVRWQRIYDFLPCSVNPTAITQRMYQSGARVWLLQPDWVIARGHESLVLLALALNVLWLILLYALLRYVVLRPARQTD